MWPTIRVNTEVTDGQEHLVSLNGYFTEVLKKEFRKKWECFIILKSSVQAPKDYIDTLKINRS